MRGKPLAARIGGVVLVVILVVAAWIGYWLWQGVGGERMDSIASWGGLTATGVAIGEPDVLTVAYMREVYRFDLRSSMRPSSRLLAGKPNDDAPVQAASDGTASIGSMLRPTAVASMPDGRVFIADALSSAVRGIDQGQLRTLGRATEVGGVAVDQHGNLYFSDRLGARVYKVGLQSGAVSVLAGTGTGGFGGDGGSADQALLSAPQGLAVDGDGNVYIADTGNERVRKVDTKGTISTLAGDGHTGFAGDGGAASSARLSSPAAMAVDGAGNVYIADTGNHRIREVTGTTISTLAGSGQGGSDGPQDSLAARSAHLGDPTALASTANGVVYVIDSFQLRKIEKGQVTYLAPPGSPA